MEEYRVDENGSSCAISVLSLGKITPPPRCMMSPPEKGDRLLVMCADLRRTW
jgi:hypothetical protein